MHPLSPRETVLDARYVELAPAVQTFHCLTGVVMLYGEVETEPPATHLARMFVWCICTPQALTRGSTRITLNTIDTEEIRMRQFPRHTMRSTLSLHWGYLTERLSMMHLFFSLEANHVVLRMRLEGPRSPGTLYPAWLRPVVLAEEFGDGDRFHFNMRANLPLLGVVAAYRGYLDLAAMERE